MKFEDLREGQRVRLLTNVWDTPPSDRLLGRKGQILTVGKLDPGHEHPVLVSRGDGTESFRVALSEIEWAER